MYNRNKDSSSCNHKSCSNYNRNDSGSNCGTGTVTLGAAASAGTINWYSSATGGSSLGTGTSFTTPSISATTTYYVDATNNGCTTGTRTAVLATINPVPTITGTTPGSNCGTGTVTLGAAASAGTINWYSSATGGSSLGTGTSFTTPSISATTTYYVDATNNGCTTGTRTAVLATINPVPTITGTTPGSNCGTGTVTLGAAASAGTINWYSSATGGSSLGTGTSFTTPSISATTTYYVDATNNGCTTGTRTAVVATINPVLIPDVTITSSSTNICTTAPSGSTPVNFSVLSSNNLGTSPVYQWKLNGNPIAGATSSTYSANGLANGSVISLAVSSNATCASPVTATSNNITLVGFTPPAPPVFDATTSSVNITTICPPESGLIYSVGADANVTNFNWSTSATGWGNIGSGAGTNSISFNETNVNDGNYNMQVTAQNACGSSSVSALAITVEKAASVYAGADASICKGGSYTIADADYSGYIKANGANAPKWTASPAASGSFNDELAKNPIFTPSANFTGTITLTITSNRTQGTYNCSVLSDQMTLTVNAPPAISGQPSTSSQTICQGNAATALTVTASGAGLSYQWYSNTTNSNSGGTLISGATSNSYTPQTSTAGTLYYYVKVSGTCTPAVTSNVSGAVTVNAPPAISGQPSTSSQTICQGNAATALTVTASGAGLSYQWYSNTTNSNSGGTLISGATSNSYTPQTSTAGTLYYYVKVSGTCTPAVTSNVSGAVTVNAPPAISGQPSTSSQTICQGNAATALTVTASGAGLSYQWYSNTTNSNSGGTLISGATSNSYTPQTSTAGTLYYYVKVSGTCTPAVTSNVSGAVTVNAPPAISGQPSTSSQTICQGNAATALTVTASGAGLSYQWYSNTTNSNSGGTLISGATSNSYTPQTSTAGTLYYYVKVSGTCTPAVTSNVSGAVTVNAPPAISGQPSTSSQTICQGNAATALTVTASGAGLSYQWYSNTTNSNSGGTLISGATSNSYTPQTSTAGTLYYYVKVSGTCTPAVTSNVSGAVTVNAPPAISGQPSTSSQTICQGNAATALTVTASGAGLSYQWYSNTTNSNSGGTLISGATSNSYTPQTSTAGTLYYYVKVSGTCTPAVTSNVSGAVTVNAPPAISGQPSTSSQTICQGNAATALTVTASGAGLSYQWYSNTTNSNSGGTLISGATSNSYTPQTSTAGTLYYYVKVSGTCTPAVTSNVSGAVTVNAPPEAVAGDNVTTCTNSGAVNITTGSSALNYSSFAWTSNGTGTISSPNSLSSATYTPGAGETGSVELTLTVTGNTGCSTSVSTKNLTINQEISITSQPDPSQAVCLTFPVSFSVTATGTNPTYQWNLNGNPIAGATSSTYSISQAKAADAGTYTVDVIGTGGCTTSTSNNAELIVNQTITFSTQPTDVAVCTGNDANFSVTAAGTITDYQWRKDGVPITDGGNIFGATSSSLTVTGASATDAGSYDVVVSGPAGQCSQAISNPATLTINTAPSITTQPVAPTATCSGSGTQTISVVATGTNLTYTWRKGGTALTDGGVVSGQGTNTLTLTNATTADAGSYDVVISGTCTPSVTSDAVAVTINTAPSITTQPVAPTATCSGSGTQTISVVATGTNLTYTWRKGGTALTNGGVVSGQGTNTLTLTNATTADAGNYDVVISGTCTPSVTSDAVAVTINTAPSITTQPVAPTATCSGSGTQTISVVATGTNLTYTWRKGGTALTNGAVVSGQGTNTLTLTNATTADAGNYDVVISGTCTPSVTSDAVAVTINTAPSITTQPVAPTATCSGSGTQTISVAATGTNLTYTWRKGGTALTDGGVVSGQGTNTLTLTNATTADAGNYDVVISGTCTPSVTSDAVAVTVTQHRLLPHNRLLQLQHVQAVAPRLSVWQRQELI